MNDEIQKRTQLLKKRVNEMDKSSKSNNSDNLPVKDERKYTFNKKVDESKTKSSNNKTNVRKRTNNDDRKDNIKNLKLEPSSDYSTTIGQPAKTGSFAIKTRILMFLKERFLNKETAFFSVDEIINEMKEVTQPDVVKDIKKVSHSIIG